ncbi:unnamed protein product [Vitrella brassicaformis CCMP3155]|uniref:Cytochrome c oxidase assembly protein COX11 n=2 Tax=Vitrella brassicaformis TaxID=1169539 RepID=A0A0G4EY69_VITBC|nr:unnamed protein product [Vitrella brassicaformis CCMP3155]|eukprot:CEM04070.1 unnamed protein product [Vitrella brassicaformis CCMP3155]
MPASYRSFVTASRPLLQSPYSASSPLLRERDGGERLMQRIKRLRLFKRKHNTPVPFVLVTIMLSSAGMTMAFTPLYDLFCQTTGYDGTTQVHKDYAPPPNPTSKASKKLLTVDFVATLGGDFPWEFKPCQKRIVVTPGETALAFFKAKNLTNEPLIGMSLYSCMPPEIGIYFNKIQCFCFEEQLLNPGEEIDMPVFFFIDPEIMEDPRLDVVENITLSYIFYSSESEVPPEYAHLQLAQRTDKVPLTPEVEV